MGPIFLAHLSCLLLGWQTATNYSMTTANSDHDDDVEIELRILAMSYEFNILRSECWTTHSNLFTRVSVRYPAVDKVAKIFHLYPVDNCQGTVWDITPTMVWCLKWVLIQLSTGYKWKTKQMIMLDDDLAMQSAMVSPAMGYAKILWNTLSSASEGLMNICSRRILTSIGQTHPYSL